MSHINKTIRVILVVLSFSLSLLFFINGCGKQEPTAEPSSSEQTMSQTEGMMSDVDAMMDMDHDQMAANANAAALAGIEQTLCPVMEGNPIDPNLFVEYEGQKVYFCCEPCKEKFSAAAEEQPVARGSRCKLLLGE